MQLYRPTLSVRNIRALPPAEREPHLRERAEYEIRTHTSLTLEQLVRISPRYLQKALAAIFDETHAIILAEKILLNIPPDARCSPVHVSVCEFGSIYAWAVGPAAAISKDWPEGLSGVSPVEALAWRDAERAADFYIRDYAGVLRDFAIDDWTGREAVFDMIAVGPELAHERAWHRRPAGGIDGEIPVPEDNRPRSAHERDEAELRRLKEAMRRAHPDLGGDGQAFQIAHEAFVAFRAKIRARTR
jgi:hypothetical protein